MNKKIILASLITLCSVGFWAIEELPSQEPANEEKAKRISTPRVTPLAETEWTQEQREVLEPAYKEGQIYNVVGTLARHWPAYKKLIVWGFHVMGDTSTLPPRERELLILRTGWLCRAEYEWGQHSVMGKKAGLTEEEIARIKEGPNAEGWSPFDAALLRAADELHKDSVISDETWAALSQRYTTEQLMDTVFAVGQYTLISMSLNSFGVQLDQGVKGF